MAHAGDFQDPSVILSWAGLGSLTTKNPQETKDKKILGGTINASAGGRPCAEVLTKENTRTFSY